jgi:hypothetical protein
MFKVFEDGLYEDGIFSDVKYGLVANVTLGLLYGPDL